MRPWAALMVAVLALGVQKGGADPSWDALHKGEVVLMMRHALAPGGGDPPGFRLDDCATQRNLSAEGRTQARRIGEALRNSGITVDAVYSSQWCRCVETAELLGLGPVIQQPALNSFFSDPERRAPQMAELKRWLVDLRPQGVKVFVTHQVVITALTGIFPQSGEGVVLRWLPGGEVAVVGRLPPP
jgi:broad specificity phosphatase PhoE